MLYALRGQPSPQTESFLVMAARDWDPTYRSAAVASLGWWEPVQRPEVLLTLKDARRDPNPEVRKAAAPLWPDWANARRCSGSARRWPARTCSASTRRFNWYRWRD